MAAVAVSPWTDLSLTGASFTSRAEADPLLDRVRLGEAATAYLGDADPRDPGASPLFGPLARRTPVLLHVGEDEVLLDDSLRYAARVEQAGGAVELHVWEGMLHVFSASLVELEPARAATARIGQFLTEHLEPGAAGATGAAGVSGAAETTGATR